MYISLPHWLMNTVLSEATDADPLYSIPDVSGFPLAERVATLNSTDNLSNLILESVKNIQLGRP